MDDSFGNQYASTKLSANHAASASYVASSTIGITSNNANNNSKLKNEINYKHLINFNQLAEKLRKIQKTNQSVGSPSVKCKKSHDTSQQIQNSSSYNTTINNNVKKQQLIYPRSISTFDNNRNLIKQKVNKKYSYNSIDRQAQYSSSKNLKSEQAANTSVYTFQQQQQQHQAQQMQPQSIESAKSSKKHKSDLSFHSSFSSSSLSSFESESFEMSCSNSSSRCSSANSFYCDKKSTNHTKSLISCNNMNNIASNSLRSKRGISINNVDTIGIINNNSNNSNSTNNNSNNVPAKQIVIRRERSIGYMQNQIQTPLSCTNINKPTIQASSSSFNTLYFNSNSTNMCAAPSEEQTSTPKVSRSRPVNKNHKSSSSSSNNEEAKVKHKRTTNTSSITSGIESNSKNSNYDNETTHKETKSELVDANTTESISSSFEINELKNRLFILEADLNNERKKLSQEKDLKKFIQFELKSRYEAEKTAALKALEAKLNADKLAEMNKLQEMYEQQKRDEFDAKQKAFENQIFNLKLKLREKSEKYSNLEKQFKEEQSKNNQLFSKSVEMTQKYNQEIKNKKETTQQQQQQLNESNELIKKRLAQIYMNLSSQNIPLTKFDSDLHPLLSQIESMSKYVTKALNDTKSEADSLRNQLDKLTAEYSNCTEQKLKLEALYKVKCKSDLNKSAQIKKCQLNYDLELMKFRNEYNYDLVKHLENQISIKDSELLDLNSKLDAITSLISTHSNYESSSNQKDIIKSLNNIMNLAANEAFKKVPLNSSRFLIIPKKKKRTENSPVKNENNFTSTNPSSNSKKVELEKSCNERNKQLHEEMIKLDRQLNEMKSLKIKLAKEKQELLELNKESLQPKSKLNVRRDHDNCMDATTFSTQNNET